MNITNSGLDSSGRVVYRVSPEDAPIFEAAPDMYEALKELVEIVATIADGNYNEMPDSYTLQPARAALAKVEGRGK